MLWDGAPPQSPVNEKQANHEEHLRPRYPCTLRARTAGKHRRTHERFYDHSRRAAFHPSPPGGKYRPPPCTATGSLTVFSDEQESTSDEVQVAIVLGLAFCPNGSCEGVDPSSTGVGTILYNGPFNPQDLPSMPTLGLHQNFTVDISPFANAGPMLLTLTHLELVGVSDDFFWLLQQPSS